jgi:hypothetical protein
MTAKGQRMTEPHQQQPKQRYSKPRPRREDHPERIKLGNGITLVRNDIVAKQQGNSVRDLNRGDKDGDPFTYIGGVKYRPEPAHSEYMAGKIKRLNPPRAGKRRRSK